MFVVFDDLFFKFASKLLKSFSRKLILELSFELLQAVVIDKLPFEKMFKFMYTFIDKFFTDQLHQTRCLEYL
jgi:hypothetical protein